MGTVGSENPPATAGGTDLLTAFLLASNSVRVLTQIPTIAAQRHQSLATQIGYYVFGQF